MGNNKTYNGFTPCDPAHWQLLQGWWSSFQGTVIPLLERNPTTGAFVASCFVHEINVRDLWGGISGVLPLLTHPDLFSTP